MLQTSRMVQIIRKPNRQNCAEGNITDRLEEVISRRMEHKKVVQSFNVPDSTLDNKATKSKH
jgi:hypothetical protein